MLNSLRYVRGKRVIKSGDVPRAFLRNLKFKPENRPRFCFPANTFSPDLLKTLRSEFGIGKESIFVMNISLYGLKEAALMWYRTISQFLESIGYRMSPDSPCVFVRGRSKVCLHVDDLLFGGEEEDWKLLARQLAERFELHTWNDAEAGLIYTGIHVLHRAEEQKVKTNMQHKIDELLEMDFQASPTEQLTPEFVTKLKGARGSLLFIARRHVECKFPTRSMALGADEAKTFEWITGTNGIIQRLKSDTRGIVFDLSYEKEVIVMLPDASYQHPTAKEEPDGANPCEEENDLDARPDFAFSNT
ncbi:unnamed protein product, partial [Amoebophrya sp. A120]|eukprot:GSA120T00020500001.1